MKNIILFLLLVSSPLMTIAQDQSLSSVPVLAGKHLQTNYPDAIVLDWIRLDTEQIAALYLENEHTLDIKEAVYTNEGHWIRTGSDHPVTAQAIPNLEWAFDLSGKKGK